MNILVVNDDGINSKGLKELAHALRHKGDVYVCAPVSQQSGKSQSITLTEEVFVYEVDYDGVNKAYQVFGTPADCTKIGLQFCADAGTPIDIVYSGINLGSNMGRDTLYSGTVGAAMEGAIAGVKSVAVSVDSHSATHFETAGKIAVDVMDFVLEELTADTIININVPNKPADEIKGVKFTVLGGRYYNDRFYKKEDGGYYLDGIPIIETNTKELCDVDAVTDGYVSITPLQFDYTDFSMMEKVQEMKLNTI